MAREADKSCRDSARDSARLEIFLSEIWLRQRIHGPTQTPTQTWNKRRTGASRVGDGCSAEPWWD
jgi:hypothetical protein